MKRTTVSFDKDFAVLLGDARSQSAAMVMKPGTHEGGPDNRHGGADQWIFVVSGSGEALIAGETVSLTANTLVLIERGEAHGFLNIGADDLRILTFYVPPAYDPRGNELPAGRG